MGKLTPMMKQYQELKEKHKDCILFFRLGDFYEMFDDDAYIASKILDIALTSRHKGESKTPMCGVPYHAAENYVAKLTKSGKKVAICEQVSDPNEPGIVKREVVRIITPGTTLNDTVLEQKSNNYIISIYPKKNYFGLAFADLTTGDFKLTEVNSYANLKTEIARLNPSECIVPEDEMENNLHIQKLYQEFLDLHIFPYKTTKKPYETLTEAYKTKSLEGFGVEKYPFGIQAAGNLYNYLLETQKQNLDHLKNISSFKPEKYMALDDSTIRNLELIFTLNDAQKKGSLLSILDKTQTNMGGRLLHSILLKPLIKKEEILERQQGVEEFTENLDLREKITKLLKNFCDLERILARLSLNQGSARDLVNIKISLQKIPEIKNILKNCSSIILQTINSKLNSLEDLTKEIEEAILDEPKAVIREGGMIKKGYNKELDEVKDISLSGKEFISQLKEKEIQKTGINSLKIGFNKVFGYYIEVTNTHKNKAPDYFIRKQTLTNAERYITPDLKEYEEKVLNAEEKINELEFELFQKIQRKVLDNTQEIQQTARYIGLLDILLSFSITAVSNNYCKPEISEENVLEIENGRHPVLEKLTFSQDFVPNSLKLNDEDQQIVLLTGPNMSGKSTILRQAALITLLAQIGSFVPADKAKIGITDRIFTRVGASDNLLKGQSTFMVEMQEVANILNNASEKSFIVLDEIGRGTSTYDGVSIAWSIMEHIHDLIKARTIFATHYHELISLADKLDRAKNFSVNVKDKGNEVIFLYQMVEGGINKSYGIEVARLAGLPQTVVDKSKQILGDLEEEVIDTSRISEHQMDLFKDDINQHPALQALKNLNIEALTPIEALQKLDELKKL